MLIEVEGPSGAGKTTLIRGLSAADNRVINVAEHEQHRRDDVGWLVGALMRRLEAPIEPLEAAFLYSARTGARARLVAKLDGDDVMVISDRFRLSLYVAARRAGLAATEAAVLTKLAARGVESHGTILLDIDHPTHVQRLGEQGHEPLGADEFANTRAYFLEAFAPTPERKLRLNTTKLSADQVLAAVVARLGLPGKGLCSASS